MKPRTRFYHTYLVFILLLLPVIHIQAQTRASDSLSTKKFNYKPFIVPALFMGYGFVALNNPTLLSIDTDFQASFDTTKSTRVDDITMLIPSISAYGLDWMGIKGKQSFKDKTLVFGTASVLVMGSVFATKSLSNRVRPNDASDDSFPSGHTAVAFMGAEFLYQEYKHISPWYGIVGYGIAATTGYLRMYNNKHWFSDVVAGAGFGIMSTKIAYLLQPHLQKKLFKKEESTSFVSPFYNGEQLGVSLVRTF